MRLRMPMPAERPSRLWQNPLSYAGILIAVVATAVGIPLMFVQIFAGISNPYTGIIVFMVLPVVAGFGLLVALTGMLWTRRKLQRQPGWSWRFPAIDLNNPRHQLTIAGGFAGGFVLLALLGITGYQTYHFTDSVQFCGQVCHTIMKPEFTAYQHSPHARVTCVECHVGPGAGWYVRSKLSGAYQVYAALFDKYPRPILTPIKNLRPAQETCEQCHWPAKFFGAQQKTFTHYLADEKNSPWQIQTLIRVGGGDSKTGGAPGIHWHMNINNDIYFIASDERREQIPWVKAVGKDGKVTEYMSTESLMTPEELAKAIPRRMECVDCHNRPSHIYHPPDHSLNMAFLTTRLDPSLPYLKREAMKLLAADYATEAEAHAAIRRQLPAFYSEHYPVVAKARSSSIEQAVATVQDIFSHTIFPEMKTDWRVHPNHVGHLNSDGCFRCHDGLHRSSDGKVITNDCNACHTFLAQGPPETIAKARLTAQPFQHPVDVGVDVSTMKCSACHTGTIGL